MPDDASTGRLWHARADGGRPSAAEVHVEIDPGRMGAGAVARLADQVRAALGVLGAPDGEVRVRLVGDDEMCRAHAKHLGDPTTTDVLTFDLSEGGSGLGAPLDVDVLVCIDQAERQGAARGHAPEREVLLYIVHAVLHCLGHDDRDDGEAARMHAEEDRVLEAIGVGATFARPDTRDDPARIRKGEP